MVMHRLQLSYRRARARRRPDDAGAWIDLGRAAIRACRHDEAAAAAEQARGFTADPTQHVAVARLFADAGDARRALDAWREVARIEPDNFAAHAYIGLSAWRAGLVDEAIDALSRAIELREDALELRRVLTQALVEAGRGAEAVRVFRSHAREDRAEDQLILARAWQATGDGLHALLALQVAERLAPMRLDVCLELSACMWRYGKPTEAAVLLDRMLSRWPDSVEMHLNAATVRSALGDPDGALAALESAERLRPDLAVIAANRGAVLFDAARYAEAVDVFRAVVERDPEDASGHIRLAMALRFQHRTVDAQREVERAIELGHGPVLEKAQALRRSLTAPPVVAAEIELARATGDIHESAMSGSLARLEFPQLLEFVRTNGWSGTVLISSRFGVAQLRAERGRLALACCSTVPGLDKRLIDHGIEPTRLATLARGGCDEARPVGLSLIEAGLLTRAELRSLVETQIRAVVRELIGWTHGYFILRDVPDESPLDPLMPVMSIEGLLLDVFREMDEAAAQRGAA